MCEVFNLFASCIPQAELSRIERGQRRQGLVPDFKVRGEEGEGDILVQRLAKARLAVAPTQAGRHGPSRSREAELASLVGYLRRSLSFTAVQQQARLLLDRLQLLGDGASEAARRRDTAVHMERQAVRERRAQAVALIHGQSIVRHGFGKLV